MKVLIRKKERQPPLKLNKSIGSTNTNLLTKKRNEFQTFKDQQGKIISRFKTFIAN